MHENLEFNSPSRLRTSRLPRAKVRHRTGNPHRNVEPSAKRFTGNARCWNHGGKNDSRVINLDLLTNPTTDRKRHTPDTEKPEVDSSAVEEFRRRFARQPIRNGRFEIEVEEPKGDSVEELLALGSAGFYRNQIRKVVRIEGHGPTYASPNHQLHPRLAQHLEVAGLRLYSHQAQVFDLLADGNNVVLTTPTASGKTLAFNLPILDSAFSSGSTSAIYIYPTKALAYDQLTRLQKLDDELGLQLFPAVYDGDTPTKERDRIKRESRLVITNPHGLHLYLGWHSGWRRLLSSLALVVIDEAHAYTGAVGGSFKLLLLRLRRLADLYNSSPRFLAASGTISNPREHLESLVGQEFAEVSQDGSGQASRDIVFWDTTLDSTLSPSVQAAYVARHLMRTRRHVAVFSNTRSQAEFIASVGSDHGNRIVPYRSGYSADVRRRVEAELREGQVRGVSATSALELGVDIGSLDAVVLNGYPGSVSAMWQRIGRAGRAGQDSIGLVMLGHDPISRSLLANAEELLRRPPEAAVTDVSVATLARHLECGAAESPLTSADIESFGERANEITATLLESGKLKRVPGGVGAASNVPHLRLPFVERELSYNVLLHSRRGAPIHETLSASQAMREAYKGAIFFHFGAPFRVHSVDHEHRQVRCEPDQTSNHTVATTFRAVSRSRLISTARCGTLMTLELAEALVVEQLTGYKEYSPSQKLVATRKLKAPSITSPAVALSIALSQPESLGLLPGSEHASLHGLEHALVKVLPLLTAGYASEVAGLTLKGDGAPSMLLYQITRDGEQSSLARVAEHIGELMRLGIALIDECECETGCPFCVLDPRCDDDTIVKSGALALARSLAKNIC